MFVYFNRCIPEGHDCIADILVDRTMIFHDNFGHSSKYSDNCDEISLGRMDSEMVVKSAMSEKKIVTSRLWPLAFASSPVSTSCLTNCAGTNFLNDCQPDLHVGKRVHKCLDLPKGCADVDSLIDVEAFDLLGFLDQFMNGVRDLSIQDEEDAAGQQ